MYSSKYYILKALTIENIVLPIIAFFAPINGVLITVGAAIALDTIMGLWKSTKNKIPITSKGLSAIASKMFLYESVVLLTFLLDNFVIGDIVKSIFSVEFLATKIAAMLFIYIEMKSIDENYKAVKGISLWNELKSMASRTKEIKEELKHIKK